MGLMRTPADRLLLAVGRLEWLEAGAGVLGSEERDIELAAALDMAQHLASVVLEDKRRERTRFQELRETQTATQCGVMLREVTWNHGI